MQVIKLALRAIDAQPKIRRPSRSRIRALPEAATALKLLELQYKLGGYIVGRECLVVVLRGAEVGVAVARRAELRRHELRRQVGWSVEIPDLSF